MCLSETKTPAATAEDIPQQSQQSSSPEPVSAAMMEAALSKLASASTPTAATPSSLDFTPRSSPPSSLNRSPPVSVASMVFGSASSPPPSMVPSAMSMVSMASMLGHHPPPPFLHMAGYPGSGSGSRGDDFAASMHKFMDRSFGLDRAGSLSPPPVTAPTNDPTANECKIVDYRGEKIAAFMIGGRTMLCLPQAFELFLKHLVGGLHTVYTKLKRLEITPIVCNVEQVRILRGLGAIQPGVNRCKLLADADFDLLYKDCTTSRLGV
jgi:hypothetical protein